MVITQPPTRYRRRHLGKKSYLERGVSEEQYKVYWDSYVQPSWITHGLDRMKRREVCSIHSLEKLTKDPCHDMHATNRPNLTHSLA